MTTTNQNWPLPTPDRLGPLYGADDVRDAMVDTLDTWSPYYLRILSRRLVAAGKIGGPSQFPNPLTEFGTWRDQPAQRSLGTGIAPAYLVSVPATVGEPDKQGTGLVIATWRAHVQVEVFGTTWQKTLDLVSWYEKAVRWCILQHAGLGGLARTTKWSGAQYSVPERHSTRSIGQAILGFDVVVPNVIDASRGPKTVPATTVPGQDPTVTRVVFDLTKVPVTEPL